MCRPSSSGRPAASAFQNGILPGSPGSRRDEHAIVRDLFDPPRRRAEQERLADAALEHHLLVEFADPRVRPAFTDQEHTVKPAVGNRAAVDDRDALRAFACRQSVLQSIPRQTRPQVGEIVGRIAPRQHVEHAFEYGSTEFRERCGAADGIEQRVDIPVFVRNRRDDLLREDVERITRISARSRPALRASPA